MRKIVTNGLRFVYLSDYILPKRPSMGVGIGGGDAEGED